MFAKRFENRGDFVVHNDFAGRADILGNMELTIPESNKRSVQEYFRLAEASETKLEFKSGEIIDMAGATYDHNRIAANLLRELGNYLKSRRCKPTGSDQRVKVADDRYCYPDITVVCGKPLFDPLDPLTSVTNPQMIIEVLSPTTEVTDRGEKFFRYIRLPSMREYVLVAQHQPRIETFFRKDDGSWIVGPVFEGLEASIRFSSLDVEIPLREIYADVEFTAPVPVTAG
jgi:Uma2 family endonuclease